VERAITGFDRDDVGDWVAQLACGHRQHVRHRPPFQQRPWVTSPGGRRSRVGAPLECRLCERAELPEGLVAGRRSPSWDEATLPAALRRDHRLAEGTWAVVTVESGRARLTARTDPPLDRALETGDTQPVPPAVCHQVTPVGAVRLHLEFFAVPAAPNGEIVADEMPDDADEGGDPACWAGLLCPDCGAVLDGGPHRPPCTDG